MMVTTPSGMVNRSHAIARPTLAFLSSRIAMSSPSSARSLLGPEYNSDVVEFPVPVSDKGRRNIAAVIEKIGSGAYRYEDIACLCGESQEELVCTRDRYGLPHRTVLCASCGLVRTNPRLDSPSYQDFYSKHYRSIYERPGHDPSSMFQIHASRAEERANFVLSHAASRRLRLLEIGCGGGWNLIPFLKLGHDAEGCDYDDNYIQAGRDRGLSIHRGSIDEMILTGRTYDIVILSHVLEHMLDPVRELGKMARLLESSGRLYVEVPSLFAVTTQLPRYWQTAHTYSFVPDTLRRLMVSAGFREIVSNDAIASLWMQAPVRDNVVWNDPRLAAKTRRFLWTAQWKARLARRFAAVHRLWVRLSNVGSRNDGPSSE